MNSLANKKQDVDMIRRDIGDTKSMSDGKPGIDKSPSAMNFTNGSNDADSIFQKHYSKELKVNEDEIPFVLAEFIENSMRYIIKEQYEKALILLQKAHGIINVISIDNCQRDKYFGYVIFINMAVWFQKMGSLEECSIALENSLVYLTSYSSLRDQTIARRIKLMQQEARIRIQLCALFSQLHQHKDALEQAKLSTKLIHWLIKDLHSLWDFYTKKKFVKEKAIVYDESILVKSKYNNKIKVLDQNDSQIKLIGDNIFDAEDDDKNSILSRIEMYNYLEEDLSLIERTAQRVKPIIETILGLLVKEKQIDDWDSIDNANSFPVNHEKSLNDINVTEDAKLSKINKILNKKIEPDMRIVLGYLNQLELIWNLNIGNLMQIVPVKIEDLLSIPRNETEFNREKFIEKIALLWVAYFWISTEIRFIIQLKEDLNYDEKFKGEESEYWHAKSLEIAWTFLPSDWPLLNHILLSYQKHYSPAQQIIKEDAEHDQNLIIIKPLKGIESCKFMPIIRKIAADNITITPSSFSPADTITNQMILSYQNYWNYGSNSILQGNNKSDILEYSSSKYKSKNTRTTRHRSASPNVVGIESESFRSGQSKQAMQEKEADLNQNSVASGASILKKHSTKTTSEGQIIDKLLNYIMKDKNITDKEKLLEALMTEEFDFDQSFISMKKERWEKDSLLIDSVQHNLHSTSYKEIHQEDSLNNANPLNELTKLGLINDFNNIFNW